MLTCCIQYTLDPHKIDDFEDYAKRWPPIIERCGGKLLGYFLPKEGANNFAVAMIDFESLSEYEQYRKQLLADPEAQQNLAAARQSRCIWSKTGRSCAGSESVTLHPQDAAEQEP